MIGGDYVYVETLPKRSVFIRDLMRSFGMKTHWKGFDYITDMIVSICDSNSDIGAMKLYEEVAKRRNCSAASVERASRAALERAWFTSAAVMLDALSLRSRFSIRSRPTVFEFVLELASYTQCHS